MKFSVPLHKTRNSDILIFHYETGKFLSWYKLEHLGRGIESNIQSLIELEEFVYYFKKAIPLPEEESGGKTK